MVTWAGADTGRDSGSSAVSSPWLEADPPSVSVGLMRTQHSKDTCRLGVTYVQEYKGGDRECRTHTPAMSKVAECTASSALLAPCHQETGWNKAKPQALRTGKSKVIVWVDGSQHYGVLTSTRDRHYPWQAQTAQATDNEQRSSSLEHAHLLNAMALTTHSRNIDKPATGPHLARAR